MKILELINSLSTEEKKQVKKCFSLENPLLRHLYMELQCLTEEEFQDKKHIIYKKVYNKQWNSLSEKHFKNQLTELFQKLRLYIAQMWIENNDDIVEHNKYSNYLNQLSKRLKSDFFEKEWKHYMQIFESKLDYYGMYKLNILMYFDLIRNPKNYAQAIEYLKSACQYSIMKQQEDISMLKYTLLTTQYLKNLHGLENLWSEKEFEILCENVKKEFNNPIDVAIKFMTEPNENKKWELVLDIYKILSNDNLKNSIRFILGQSIFNYATYLSLEKKENEKAIEIMDFIYKNGLIEHCVKFKPVFYFNYSTVNLKLGHTSKALEFQKKVIQDMESIPIARKTLFLIRNIYLNILNKDFTNTYSDIMKIIPDLFKEDQILYVRILLVIYLIDTKDIASAIRESDNIKRSHNFGSELAAEESQIVDFIHQILLALSKEKIHVEKLEKAIKTIYQSVFWHSTTHLLKIWLDQYIQGLITNYKLKNLAI